jgi:hypothetical protein
MTLVLLRFLLWPFRWRAIGRRLSRSEDTQTCTSDEFRSSPIAEVLIRIPGIPQIAPNKFHHRG